MKAIPMAAAAAAEATKNHNISQLILMHLVFVIFFSSLFATDAFTLQSQFHNNNHPNRASSSSSSLSPLPTSTLTSTLTSTTTLQCICINCSRVTDCAAYHFVESKHSQPHINDDPTFTPVDGSPTIHVNIRTNRENAEGEMGRLWSEHVEETRKAEERAASADASTSSSTDDGDDGGGDDDNSQQDRLVGEEKYDLSVKTTYEYDVVACEDFVEDHGCWVRNMPEEIRLANPDFVPT